ncbi:hypothetical protein SEA_HONK_81 [Microbacterium phage Honk]|uniref:Uncharacterized protein n=1 Tax=Microbacterium phage Honk TaxID=2836095 RepID=A0A8F3EA24_9CAUD|nr:hypothetical protein SEA_HONK_81 [Microbacterium phage Honk]
MRLGFIVASDGVVEEVTTDALAKAAATLAHLWHEVEDTLALAHFHPAAGFSEWASREQAGRL